MELHNKLLQLAIAKLLVNNDIKSIDCDALEMLTSSVSLYIKKLGREMKSITELKQENKVHFNTLLYVLRVNKININSLKDVAINNQTLPVRMKYLKHNTLTIKNEYYTQPKYNIGIPLNLPIVKKINEDKRYQRPPKWVYDCQMQNIERRHIKRIYAQRRTSKTPSKKQKHKQTTTENNIEYI